MAPEKSSFLLKEEVDPIWKKLKIDVGKATERCLHYVQACMYRRSFDRTN
ncbi:MAG: hypothetical protein KKE17_05750 [Proteobacteria bacterium]|nr:hypothetical protein [Pseudomonadota bacterium]MBU1709491.1 hypothetical protein [Pseudomonadota bacterium]